MSLWPDPGGRLRNRAPGAASHPRFQWALLPKIARWDGSGVNVTGSSGLHHPDDGEDECAETSRRGASRKQLVDATGSPDHSCDVLPDSIQSNPKNPAVSSLQCRLERLI